jgi:uncharacterized phosphatase
MLLYEITEVMMITKKEFYFVRHGQTDPNLLGYKVDHYDVSLNAFGREQAQMIEPLIASLAIDHVCFSPFKRAKETKDILSARLSAEQWEMPQLGECSAEVWREMTSLDIHTKVYASKAVQEFMCRTVEGINKALDKEGSILIVAHGGMHWALCYLMGIEQSRVIGNCVPVQFSYNADLWKMRKLI